MILAHLTPRSGPDAVDRSPIASEDGARVVEMVDRMVTADRVAAPRRGGSPMDQSVEMMAQHPRTPRKFWAAIGWNDQIGATDTFDGSALRRKRIERGLSRTQCGALLGVTQWAVWSWESGHEVPTPFHRRKLADVFAGTLMPVEGDPRD